MSKTLKLTKATLVHHLSDPHGGVSNPMSPAELRRWSYRALLSEHARLLTHGPCLFAEITQ